MRVCFGHPKVRLIEKYNGRNDLHDHLAKETEVYGVKPQPKWFHLFCHTLDVIPMNWCLEKELRHGIEEWDILHRGFLMTFSFEDGFLSINEALHEIKTSIFRILWDPLDLIQPDWTTQLSHALECYNVTMDEEDEKQRKINIP